MPGVRYGQYAMPRLFAVRLIVDASCSGQHKIWLKAMYEKENAYVVQISISM